MRASSLIVIVVACVLALAGGAMAAEYQMSRIGCLPGDTNSRAIGINDRGQVVGESWGSGSYFHVFVWDASAGMRELQCTLPNTNMAWPTGINGSGSVIGWTYDVKLERERAVLWNSQGQASELAGLSSDMNNYAAGIGDTGRVVGRSWDRWGHGGAVLWDPVSGLRELVGITANSGSAATSVNAYGRIAGWSGTGYSHPVWWDSALRIHDIGLLQGCETGSASDINDNGEIVGTMGDLWLNYPRAFYWSASTGIRDLRPGYPSEALAINSSGMIVGRSGNRAYLWNRSGIGQELLTPSDYNYSRAYDINGAGYVAGDIQTSTGGCEAVVWIPVPEPSCLAALAVGAVGLFSRRRSQTCET